ncbi:MAG: Fur family transcriptional regulator [Desulfobacteraceae bacterium]|jgi:Fe2+ or Zn2+ uptake regulation protein
MTDSIQTDALLQNAGVRPTQARTAIMGHLIERGTHPTTEELNASLIEKGIRIPTATLYQSLEKLTAAGLLIRFPGTDGQVRYDANLSHHHHMICTVCQRVVDISISNPLSSLSIFDDKTGEPVLNWTLENAEIELKGRCPACAKK